MHDIYRGGCRATFSIWKAQPVGNKWRSIPVTKDQMFIDENGQTVKDCIMRLSLKDFVCEEKEHRLGDFEDVPLEISSTKLHCIFNDAFGEHVMDEAEQVIDRLTEKAGDALTKTFTAKKLIQEERMEDVEKGTVMAKKVLANVRNIISEVGNYIVQLRSSMEDMEAKMDKVDDKMDDLKDRRIKVEKRAAEVETKIAEVETKMAEIRAEEEKIIEADEAVDSQQVIPEEGIAGATGMDDAITPEAFQPQPVTPRTPDQRSMGSRLRSALRLSPKR
ncbi:hypothetical protein NKR23_g8949 [Pleurostoma richardsiae]|uniref:Uncharacterized protein n=1 Tax=Pleurostoma richardsiae TaxID=41990 RepID=A0AA38RRQ5_9PEZI|nr:hypothetical protein NKR23_g8949 [Pleurostoma richardsiae]